MTPRPTGPTGPAINLPPGVLVLMAVIVITHLALSLAGEDLRNDALLALGFIPLRFSAEAENPGAWATLLSYQALHAGWLHLGVNTLALAAFGSAVERMAGPARMAVLGVGAGVAGALAQWAADPGALALLIGASGLTSGLFGAALIGMRRLGGGGGLLPLAAIWIAVAILSGQMAAPDGAGSIAWIAHIGGFLFGLAGAALLLRPRTR
ncbi:MAG: rhomboid family intramembrane serine protease [Pseudomonadota bacterium]